MSTMKEGWEKGRRKGEGEKGKETGEVSANNWCLIHYPPPPAEKKTKPKPKNA